MTQWSIIAFQFGKYHGPGYRYTIDPSSYGNEVGEGFILRRSKQEWRIWYYINKSDGLRSTTYLSLACLPPCLDSCSALTCLCPDCPSTASTAFAGCLTFWRRSAVWGSRCTTSYSLLLCPFRIVIPPWSPHLSCSRIWPFASWESFTRVPRRPFH